MSNDGSSPLKAGLGVWPKVLIWGAVIVIGFLYIRSVAHRDLAPAAPARAPIAKESPAPPPAGKFLVPDAPKPAEPKPVAKRAPDTAPRVAVPAPTEQSAQPAAQPAERTTSDVTAPITPQGAPAVTDKPAEAKPTPRTSVTVSSASEQRANSEGTSTAAAETKTSAKAAVEEPSPVTPEAQAKTTEAVPAAPEAAKQESAAIEPTAAPQTQPRRATPPGFQAREAERARILAEYEAMRKAAEEEWRRMRENMGAPPVLPMPYAPAPPSYPGPAVNR